MWASSDDFDNVMTENLIDLTKTIVGKTEREAEGELISQGYYMQIVKLDGEELFTTAEFNPHRVNVEVEGGLITSVDSIG